MNQNTLADRLMPFALSLTVLGLAFSLPAEAQAPAESATITVFADRYVMGGVVFDDLDELDRRVGADRARRVDLLICGPQATRALKAAVHRFRHVPVQMRVPDIDERECMSKAAGLTPVSRRQGRPPFGIDDEAVERYWLDIMP